MDNCKTLYKVKDSVRTTLLITSIVFGLLDLVMLVYSLTARAGVLNAFDYVILLLIPVLIIRLWTMPWRIEYSNGRMVFKMLFADRDLHVGDLLWLPENGILHTVKFTFLTRRIRMFRDMENGAELLVRILCDNPRLSAGRQ